MNTKYYIAKWYNIIGVVVIAYVLGFILGFATCSTTPKANAASSPTVMNTSNWSNYERIQIRGKSYLIFHNETGSDIEVVKE